MSKLHALVFAIACFGESTVAYADSTLPLEVGWNYGDLESPRIAALGGALRAFSNSVDALLINPANMAAVPVYHLRGFLEIWPEANRQSYGAAIVDSVVSRTKLAGGIAGAYTRQNPQGLGREALDVRMALAFPFSDRFMIGVGARYLRLLQNGVGPLGFSLASGGLQKKVILQAFGLDVGAMLRIGDYFRAAVVGNNVNSPDNGLQPSSLGGGLGFGNDTVTIEADALADFTTWERTTMRGMGGVEFLAADHYPLRLGYHYDSGVKSHALSGGLGYVDQTIALEAALRRSVSGPPATAIFVALTYHVDATGAGSSAGDVF